MNNACPSCGAVYAVALKDVSRKIKCKKCGSALRVAEKGLVLDQPEPEDEEAPVAAAEVEEEENLDEDVAPRNKKGKKGNRDRGAGMNAGAMLGKVGGIPTILFGFGVFLVIFFTFMQKIGEAAVLRADMGVVKVQTEMAVKLEAVGTLKGKDGATPSADEIKKVADAQAAIRKEFETRIKDAQENLQNERINNVRGMWSDRYGVMFGFIFVAFGCIGYLRTEQPMVMRIVAAVILSFMMIVMFFSFGGGSGSGGERATGATPAGGMGATKGGGPGGPGVMP